MSDMKDSNPTVGQPFKTGTRGEKIFVDWLPDDWIPRKQGPDFFVDYLVEIVERGEPTGRHLAAQIKGVKVGTNSATPLKYSARGKHVRYWLHRCQHPVFVFLIDTEKRTGHWVFAQKFACEQITKAALEKQKTCTLRFSEKDDLADKERFFETLRGAEQYVRDLHPGSVQAALVKQRVELEKKEPRLAYKIEASEGVQTIHVSPKVPFTLKIEVHKEHAGETIKAIAQALESGSDLTLPLNKVKLTGSPLFEEFNGSEAHILMQCGRHVPDQVILTRADAINPKPLFVEGMYRFGTKVATFRSTSGDGPVRMACTLGPLPEPEKMAMELEIMFSLHRWHGQPVLQLPYFEAVLDLLAGMVSGSGMKSEFISGGIPIASGRHEESRNQDIVSLHNLVSWLQRCRFVAMKFAVSPQLPRISTITTEQWEMVEDLAVLLAGSRRIVPMPNLSARCSLHSAPETELKEGMFGCLRLDNEKPDLRLFGIPLTSMPIRHTYTNVNVMPASVGHEGHQILGIKGTDSTLKIIESY
jgi:hypothetical protein